MKTIQSIPLQEIDLTENMFSVNFLPDLQKLRYSIEQKGVIQPVLLRRRREGYQIVCGFRRVSIVKELGTPEIRSQILDEKEMDDFQLYSLSLHENLTTRGFNTVEKAIALSKMVNLFHIPPDDVIHSFMPLLSLETNEKILKTYLALAEMEVEVKTYVLQEEVSRSNIRKLSTFSHDERMALLSFFPQLKLGENRLREILTYLEELSGRDRCSIREVLQRPEIESVLSQKELTPAQRTEQIKKVLLMFRYPRMHQKEKSFEEKKKNLNLPPGLLLHHQPFFEGKGLKAEFQFDSIKEYKNILKDLADMGDRKEFEELLQKD